MNKSSAIAIPAAVAPAMKTVGQRILTMLKNKGVQALGGAGVGAGLGAAENATWFKDAEPTTKGINLLSGALSGAVLPFAPLAGATALTGKQIATSALNTYQKDAPMRQNIANTQLAAASAAKDTAGTEQSTAKMLLEKARNLSHTDKALYGVAGAGLLGAGIYGANSLLNRSKSPKPPVSGSGAAKKGPSKIRFDVPTESMPPEFFQGLLKAEQQGKPKYACFASRNELLQEIAADLA